MKLQPKKPKPKLPEAQRRARAIGLLKKGAERRRAEEQAKK